MFFVYLNLYTRRFFWVLTIISFTHNLFHERQFVAGISISKSQPKDHGVSYHVTAESFLGHNFCRIHVRWWMRTPGAMLPVIRWIDVCTTCWKWQISSRSWLVAKLMVPKNPLIIEGSQRVTAVGFTQTQHQSFATFSIPSHPYMRSCSPVSFVMHWICVWNMCWREHLGKGLKCWFVDLYRLKRWCLPGCMIFLWENGLLLGL